MRRLLRKIYQASAPLLSNKEFQEELKVVMQKGKTALRESREVDAKQDESAYLTDLEKNLKDA